MFGNTCGLGRLSGKPVASGGAGRSGVPLWVLGTCGDSPHLGEWGPFPGGTSGKEPSCQCRRHKSHRFDPWAGKIPWRRAWQLTPVFLPGESHGQKSLAGHSP